MRLLTLILTLAVCTAPAVAGPVEDTTAAYRAAYHTGDYATALRLMRPLADQGDADAQFSLGLMYQNGYGVPQDYVQAMAWYRKAAEQGDAAAQNNLGNMYFGGRGVQQDYVRAHMWYNLAASRFSVSEKEARETAVKNRDRIAAMMTAAQIAEAQKLAREWKPKQ